MLVIVGLLVGGVLVGADLIRSAGERGQITQIEKYNTAVNTFRDKFNALPGDMNATTAAQFGFSPRGTGSGDGYAGSGDGNGLIEGFGATQYYSPCGYCVGAGEPVLFWTDLTYANGNKLNLIEGSYYTSLSNGQGNWPGMSATMISTWFPVAKIGSGNIVYAWSQNGLNYFGISATTGTYYGWFYSAPAITVRSAYNIDQKIDDGLPQTGKVLAEYVNAFPSWAGANPGTATIPSPATCYDNSGNASAPMVYSLNQNNGAGVNCALSFKFQ